MFKVLISIWVCFISTTFGSFDLAENCDIFCRGPLLEAVQNAHLFEDSKHFVDMPLKYTPADTLKAFRHLANKTDADAIRQFVDYYFLPPGDELESCDPSDWTPEPKSFDKIVDPTYRKWAYDIHAKWRTLCRKAKEDVLKNPNLYSLIPPRFPFVAPGGRFREFYYWDSYWIVKGLLASEMYKTAKDMIKNLAEMVQKYGFVPNGGRVYYLQRSQPPVLAGCVRDYYEKTYDFEFVKEMLPILDVEQEFFRRFRNLDWVTPDGTVHHLYQYRVSQDAPRAESYREDVSLSADAENDVDKKRIWSDVASACESGWDFSTRWFSNTGRLRGIRTRRVVPVDLNAFICWNDEIISSLAEVVGNESLSRDYAKRYSQMKKSMSKVFWDDTDGTWYDLDLDTKSKSNRYYVSNAAPLFANCLEDYTKSKVQHQILNYLKRVNFDHYTGGLPTSLHGAHEQWDGANGWAPSNHMVIEGLRHSDDPELQNAALSLADRWIRTNYVAYATSGGKMFEKYNVAGGSSAGGGGEYEVQEGFGWTNGVVLDLLMTYGSRLQAPTIFTTIVHSNSTELV